MGRPGDRHGRQSAANVATAGPGLVSRVIAGWPALALLIALKQLSGMIDHHSSSRPTAVTPRAEPDPEHASFVWAAGPSRVIPHIRQCRAGNSSS